MSAPCDRCGSTAEPETIIEPAGKHYARLVCGGCKRWIKFLPKPDSEKVGRPKAHTNLVDRYGHGYCELCLRIKAELPKGQTLEAQHVLEFQHGGSEARENIWIVCTSCHLLIHHMRNYHGHSAVPLAEMEIAS